MKKILLKDVESYIHQNIGEYHSSRINRIKKINLKVILQKKKPISFQSKKLNHT
jgi:hypothetical protein